MPAFEAIQTVSISSPTSSVTFSSIPQNYKNLQVRILARTSNNGGGDRIIVRTNSLTSGYSAHTMWVNPSASSTTFYTESRTGANGIWTAPFSIPDTVCVENVFGVVCFDINDYASSGRYKSPSGYTGFFDSSNRGRFGYFGGFATTSAISSLTFVNEYSTNFVSGSVFALYGLGA